MKRFGAVLIFAVLSGIATAETLTCDRQGLTPVTGMTAEQTGKTITLTWTGEANQQLRASFAIHNGQPQVVEMAAREGDGAWAVLVLEKASATI